MDELQLNYDKVLNKLQARLHEAKSNGMTYAPRLEIAKYSLTDPSIEFSVGSKITVIYDIEVSHDIHAAIVSKWTAHSAKCTRLFLVVPEEIKSSVETICAKHLHNYEVISFKFVANGLNTEIEMDL